MVAAVSEGYRADAASDPFAIAMLKKWKNVKMPTVKLSDSEIEALINYLGEKQNDPPKD